MRQYIVTVPTRWIKTRYDILCGRRGRRVGAHDVVIAKTTQPRRGYDARGTQRLDRRYSRPIVTLHTYTDT
jgi:hypothetical protein